MKRCEIIIFPAVLLFFFLFSGTLHAADGLIKKVVFHEKNGSSESVVFFLNGPWLPKAFALKGETPRVVFDFVDTSLARTVPSSIKTNGTMIRKIRIGRHSKKTRVVLDLTAGGEFNFDQQFDEAENILTIQLFSADFPEKENEKPVVAEVAEEDTLETTTDTEIAELQAVVGGESPPEESAKEIVETVEPVETKEIVETLVSSESSIIESGAAVPDPLLSDVAFENTSNRGEMVLFKLNGFYPPTVSGKEEGTPLVICDFAGTRLGKKVVKEQAIQGEFIERVDVRQLDESDLVRVTLELVPNKNYDLQQVFFKEDNLFVIIVNSYDAVDKLEK